jgi:hypothetical protein
VTKSGDPTRGCRELWQGEVQLPLIDARELLAAVAPQVGLLKAAERVRDVQRPARVYTRAGEQEQRAEGREQRAEEQGELHHTLPQPPAAERVNAETTRVHARAAGCHSGAAPPSEPDPGPQPILGSPSTVGAGPVPSHGPLDRSLSLEHSAHRMYCTSAWPQTAGVLRRPSAVPRGEDRTFCVGTQKSSWRHPLRGSVSCLIRLQ